MATQITVQDVSPLLKDQLAEARWTKAFCDDPAKTIEKKAGYNAAFVARWGINYEAMLVQATENARVVDHLREQSRMRR